MDSRNPLQSRQDDWGTPVRYMMQARTIHRTGHCAFYPRFYRLAAAPATETPLIPMTHVTDSRIHITSQQRRCLMRIRAMVGRPAMEPSQ